MFHLARNFTSGSNLNQISFSNSRADLALGTPGATVFNELRPIRIKSALRWLGGVNTATCFHEEVALFARRLPQPAELTVPNDVPGLKLCNGHVQESSGVLDVLFG